MMTGPVNLNKAKLVKITMTMARLTLKDVLIENYKIDIRAKSNAVTAIKRRQRCCQEVAECAKSLWKVNPLPAAMSPATVLHM